MKFGTNTPKKSKNLASKINTKFMDKPKRTYATAPERLGDLLPERHRNIVLAFLTRDRVALLYIAGQTL